MSGPHNSRRPGPRGISRGLVDLYKSLRDNARTQNTSLWKATRQYGKLLSESRRPDTEASRTRTVRQQAYDLLANDTDDYGSITTQLHELASPAELLRAAITTTATEPEIGTDYIEECVTQLLKAAGKDQPSPEPSDQLREGLDLQRRLLHLTPVEALKVIITVVPEIGELEHQARRKRIQRETR